MSKERWKRIEVIFNAASELPAEARHALLDHQCDDDIRQEVEALLRQHDDSTVFLRSPAVDMVAETLSPGTKVGPYEVVEIAGIGGMGRVYRARDTRLKRDVAIKTLPIEFLNDTERLARFEHEAMVLASLNHPNIAAIHDVIEGHGAPLLVLEFVDGITLKEALQDGPLPLDKTLRFAHEIALALETAHASGIMHRDLKPANIKITADGKIKVLDFGLAKALMTAEPERDLSAATVLRRPESDYSFIPGTPAYMSPEQACGGRLDQRTDIWAVGCLIYEMMTGVKAFGGETASDTLQSILNVEPNWTLLPTDAPHEVTNLLARCLNKDANHRLASVADLRHAIEKIQRAPEYRRYWMAAIPIIALATVALLVLNRHEPENLRAEQMRQLTFERELEFHPAFSPDGQKLAYVATSGDRTDIYVRPVSGGARINLTKDLDHYMPKWPRWSPDGKLIAFVTRGSDRSSIQVLPSSGGVPQEVVRLGVSWTLGHSWSPDGKKLAYVDDHGIYAISLEDGAIKRLGEAKEPHSPSWSPDGKWIAYTSGNAESLFSLTQMGSLATSAIAIIPAGGGEPLELTDRGTSNSSPVWMPDSRSILFVSNRGGNRDVFDLKLSQSGRPVGEPYRITTGLNTLSVDVSPAGEQLAYMTYRTKGNLWTMPVPKSGPVPASLAKPVTMGSQFIEIVGLSRDGKWLAFDSNLSGNQDIYRMMRGTQRQEKLTTSPYDDFCPSWSTDGKWIAFHSFRNGNRDIYVMLADGTGEQRVTSDQAQERCPTWSPDGSSLVFFSDKSGHQDIYIVSRKGGSWDKPRPLDPRERVATFPLWSPDGSQIAYVDWVEGIVVISPDGTNRRQLFPKTVGLTPLHIGGWSSDSKTIYFRSVDRQYVGHIWSVPAAGGPPTRLVDGKDPDRIEFATDGKEFFFSLTERDSDLWILKLRR